MRPEKRQEGPKAGLNRRKAQKKAGPGNNGPAKEKYIKKRGLYSLGESGA